MPRWIDPSPVEIPASFGTLNLLPLIEQTLIRRGFTTPDSVKSFLDPDSQPSISPYELPGMDSAIERILLAIRDHELICIWGDFDVDGQTSTALLVQTLQALGADVLYQLPIRAVSSHGVHIPQLTENIDRGAKLILTCDTGINAHEAVNYARSRGVEFIITDHHELGETLPEAVSIVNPKLLPREHPLINLAGVGVAYKLAEALLEQQPSDKLNLKELLDLVALGLIADVALPKAETRRLTQKGLLVLKKTQRIGLKIIAELANESLEQANEEFVGFVLGPRLNALGRLGDANPAVELLITSDPVRARVLAAQLEGLNSQRKLLTSQVYRAAEAQLRADPSLLTQPAIVLGHAAWPGGIVGIVAGRLKERYNKPVILFNTAEGAPARGSARSIEGLHITEAIASQSELLLGFGGHPMAAGLSLEQENMPAFRVGLGKSIEGMLGDAAYEEPSLQIDAWLPLEQLSLDLANSLEQLAPFGAGNPALKFATRDLILKSVTSIGRAREHRRLNIEDVNGNQQSILWWNSAEETIPEGKFDIAYSLRATTFRGERQLSLQFIAYRTLEPINVEIKSREREIVDLRKTLEQVQNLDVQIYAEGQHNKEIGGMDRFGLQPSDELVIYTVPPGSAEFGAILDQVNPQKIYLAAKILPSENTDAFLKRLAGLAKYAIAKKRGMTNVRELAAALAQREATVQIGLEWLAAGGHIAVTSEEDAVLLSTGNGAADQYVQKELYVAVKGLLEETAAYRSHFQLSNPDRLFN
ncbi:MAG: single-stranded-DNA-specific exonuclease RecJ [Anaerolineae bacterium]|nr:single-stranded-DNA-specific exonuclease RecJ [Anaerolineae bacterium]